MKLGLSFGLDAVVAGQKSATVNAEPQLVVSSTTGKFTVTSPVSKALSVAPGENIMFFNNISRIEESIATNNADILAYAEQKGYDLSTVDGQNAVLADLTMWFIAKGVKKVDKQNNPLMVRVRYTKEDKEAYIAQHGVEMVAALDEEGRNVLLDRLGVSEATDEELAGALTIDDVDVPEVQACEGSKTATTGSATGTGCLLNFTDTAIWNKLKADLEDKNSKNRIYKVLLSEPVSTQFNNGFELVDVVAYPIVFAEDAQPLVRAKA